MKPKNFNTKLITPYSQELEAQMLEMYKRLSTKDRRLYAGVEALKIPYVGISYISRLFGCARDTVLQGIKDLNEDEILPQNRVIKAGGGRSPLLDKMLWYRRSFFVYSKRAYSRRSNK